LTSVDILFSSSEIFLEKQVGVCNKGSGGRKCRNYIGKLDIIGKIF